MLSINVPPVTIVHVAQIYNDTTIPIPNPPTSGPKRKETRKECLEGAAAWRRNSLLMGVARAEADRQWIRQVDRCLLTTPAPRPRVAGFTPDYTPPPKGQPTGNGTRFLAFVPLGQINPIGAIVDFFTPKPKAKPKAKPKPKPTWADRQECINRELDRQINGGEKVNNAAARLKCGG